MLAQVFRTDQDHCYVYDAMTNRILSVKKTVPCEDGKDAEKQILDAFHKRGLVTDKPFAKVVWQSSFEKNLQAMQHGVPRLMLQLTRRCNLNCRYCVYSGNYAHMQPHADEDMSEATIRKAINRFAAYCTDRKEVFVDMYGGEALLRLDLMMYTVQYSKEVLRDQKVSFRITSNGLLLNNGVGKWLSENPEIKLTVTLNGPYHDAYRVTAGGQGSLAIILKNLKEIRQNYPVVWDRQIQFLSNIVHSGQLLPLKEFYEKEIGKPPVSITHIRAQHGNDVIREILSEKEAPDRGAELKELFCRKNDAFLDAYFGNGIRAAHTRHIFDNDANAYVGSCFPLVDRIFVHCDGNLGICESACDKVIVGNIETGLNIPVLEKIYKGTAKLFHEKCRCCWAQRLCTICLKDLFSEDGELIDSIPDSFCKLSREYSLEQLKMYCTIAQTDPNRMDAYD